MGEDVAIEPLREQYLLVYQLVKRRIIIILMRVRGGKLLTAVQVAEREVSLGANHIGAEFFPAPILK
jgi:hypothetical protein